MPAIAIRVLRRGDEAVLASVAPDTFDDPIDPASAAAFLADPHHHLVVALERGTVVGFVSAVHYLHPDKPRPELWINEVGISPAHQGRGLGKQVLAAVLDLGCELGCTEAWVLTDRRNRPAMKLYAGQGGVEYPDDMVMFTFRLQGEDQGQAQP